MKYADSFILLLYTRSVFAGGSFRRAFPLPAQGEANGFLLTFFSSPIGFLERAAPTSAPLLARGEASGFFPPPLLPKRLSWEGAGGGSLANKEPPPALFP